MCKFVERHKSQQKPTEATFACSPIPQYSAVNVPLVCMNTS